MQNMTIRKAAKEAGVSHWQIAEAIGVNEFSFSRMLRHELPKDQTAKILEVIREIAGVMNGGKKNAD